MHTCPVLRTHLVPGRLTLRGTKARLEGWRPVAALILRDVRVRRAAQDEDRTYSAAWRGCAVCAAAHTTCAVAGIGTFSLPTASVMALMTAAGAAIAPASPQPLIPSGFDGHLVSVVSTLNDGRLWARGIE